MSRSTHPDNHPVITSHVDQHVDQHMDRQAFSYGNALDNQSWSSYAKGTATQSNTQSAQNLVSSSQYATTSAESISFTTQSADEFGFAMAVASIPEAPEQPQSDEIELRATLDEEQYRRTVAEEELAGYRIAFDKLVPDKMNLEDELAASRAEGEGARKALEEVVAKLSNCEMELEATKQELSDAMAAGIATGEEVWRARGTLAEKEGTVARLEAALAAKEEELTGLRMELHSKEDHLARISAALLEKTERLDDLRKAAAGLERRYTDQMRKAQEESLAGAQAMLASEREKLANSEAASATKERELVKTRIELTAKEMLVVKTQNYVDDISRALAVKEKKFAEAEAKLVSCGQKLADTEAALKTKEEELAGAQAVLAVHGEKLAETEASLKNALTSKEKQLAEMRSATQDHSSTATNPEGEIEELKMELFVMTLSRVVALRYIKKLTEEQERLEGVKAEHLKRIAELEQHNSWVEAELEEAARRYKQLTMQLTQLEVTSAQAATEAQSNIALGQKRIAELETRLLHADMEISRQKQLLQTFSQELQVIQVENKQLKEKVRDSGTENDVVQTENKQLKEKVRHNGIEIQELQAEKARLQEKIDKMEVELELLRSSHQEEETQQKEKKTAASLKSNSPKEHRLLKLFGKKIEGPRPEGPKSEAEAQASRPNTSRGMFHSIGLRSKERPIRHAVIFVIDMSISMRDFMDQVESLFNDMISGVMHRVPLAEAGVIFHGGQLGGVNVVKEFRRLQSVGSLKGALKGQYPDYVGTYWHGALELGLEWIRDYRRCHPDVQSRSSIVCLGDGGVDEIDSQTLLDILTAQGTVLHNITVSRASGGLQKLEDLALGTKGCKIFTKEKEIGKENLDIMFSR